MKRIRYQTRQIDLKNAEQLRISYGTRTMFVYANGRGLHFGKGGYAKFDAEQIARGLNLLVQYGMEDLPKVKNRLLTADLADLELEDDDD